MHLYLHIPFCRKACHYCDFHFSTQLDAADRMINAICTELVLRKYECKTALETIYFGGGTPSVLTKPQLDKILHVIRENYLIAPEPEITLEANPDDLSPEKLIELKDVGINRLSIGIQSFRDEDLKWMNRSHDAQQAKKSVIDAQQAGFSNITIDLIYGIPDLSASDWEKNLMQAVKLNPTHISAYCLTIEKKTVFGHRFSKGEMSPVDEDAASEQFLFMRKILSEKGYEQYEVSNFARQGFYSRHNTSYWEGKNYIGIGPSAHSFDGENRRWNVSNNSRYIKGIEEGSDYFETEELSQRDKLNEFIMISLRTMKGIDLGQLEALFGSEILKNVLQSAEDYLTGGDLIIENNFLKTTVKGILLTDRIAGELFQLKM